MKYAASIVATAVAMAALAHGGTANAADKWWPAKIYNLDSGSAKVLEYSPLEKAAKPWNICVLFPHMKDTFWVAADYGVVEEARADGREHDALRGGRLREPAQAIGAVRRLHGRQFRRDHRRADFGGRARQEDSRKASRRAKRSSPPSIPSPNRM